MKAVDYLRALIAGGVTGIVAVLLGATWHVAAAALAGGSVLAAAGVHRVVQRRLRHAQRAQGVSPCRYCRRPARFIVVSVRSGRTVRTCGSMACVMSVDDPA